MSGSAPASTAENIGKDELLRLTLKMKKRMEALEVNRGELSTRVTRLLLERKQLLDLMKTSIPIPASPLEDQDLELGLVEAAWKKWEEQKAAPPSPGGAATVVVDNNEEVLRLRASEECLKQQVADLEKALSAKTSQFDALKREADSTRAQLEEKVMLMQMQSNSSKSNLEAREKDATVAAQQVKNLTKAVEEKTVALNSHKEIVAALQSKLGEIEPELDRTRAKAQEQQRIASSLTVLKAEQEALLQTTRKELKTALDSREALLKQVRGTDDFKGKYDVATNKVAKLEAQISDLQADVDEKAGTITRLRAEAQNNERNHAMRTAMLAAAEAQLETTRQELAAKDLTNKEALERVTALQTSLSSAEARLAERVSEYSKRTAQLESEAKVAAAESAAKASALATEHEAALEGMRRDYAKKSATARTMLSEKEEEARVLSQRVQELQAEISSGAPSERKIFEFARIQSQREAAHSAHSDTRELAFHQLQSTLSAKDLQLAEAQSTQSALSAEVAELRRSVRREGVNMDYLKNIIHQVRPSPSLTVPACRDHPAIRIHDAHYSHLLAFVDSHPPLSPRPHSPPPPSS